MDSACTALTMLKRHKAPPKSLTGRRCGLLLGPGGIYLFFRIFSQRNFKSSLQSAGFFWRYFVIASTDFLNSTWNKAVSHPVLEKAKSVIDRLALVATHQIPPSIPQELHDLHNALDSASEAVEERILRAWETTRENLHGLFNHYGMVAEYQIPSSIKRDLTTTFFIKSAVAAYVLDAWDPYPVGETVAAGLISAAIARGLWLERMAPHLASLKSRISGNSAPALTLDIAEQ
jgi:hypothetical protein